MQKRQHVWHHLDDYDVEKNTELIINGVEDKVLSEDYDEDYNNYSRIVCEDNQ